MSTEKLVGAMIKRPATTQFLSFQAERIMALGEDQGWPARIMGVAPVPTKPITHNGWVLVPLTQDNSRIPARAIERVRAIYRDGIRPKAFLIAHELPKQPIPTGQPSSLQAPASIRQFTPKSLPVPTSNGILGVAAAALLALGAVSFVGPVLLGILGLVLLDPALIVVTEDDVWIAIDAWLD